MIARSPSSPWRERMKRSRIVVLVAALMAGLAAAGPAAAGQPKPKKPKLNPVIFVHGFVGLRGPVRVAGAALHEQRLSAAADRGCSTTTPRSALDTREQVYAHLDALIARHAEAHRAAQGRPARPLARHHADAGVPRHAGAGRAASRTTSTSTAAPPRRLPGGVPTLAVWAGVGTPGQEITARRT